MNINLVDTSALAKFWTLIHACVQEFLAITEPHIEDAAIHHNVPIELYYYGELGLNNFSIEDFQHRDPFSNPEQFNRLFPRLEIKGWIVPMREPGRYEVSAKAREAVRRIIEVGDGHLLNFEVTADVDLEQLLVFLNQITLANRAAPQPAQKWALQSRFHVADRHSPIIVQIREALLDLFAFRDDAYLSAARPHFNQAGIVWSVLGAVATGSAVTAEQMAETMAFRGYELYEYQAAIKAAVEVGWLEPASVPGTFRPSATGRTLIDQVEKLSDEYFYAPWSVFSPQELDEFYQALAKLREQLHAFKKEA